MHPYLFGKLAALEKLGLSLRAVTEEGVENLPKILSKMAPDEVEALRNYVTSGAAGGIRADIWKTQPDLAQRLEAALKNIAAPSDFDQLYTKWRQQNPVHPASKEQVRAAYERARGQRANRSTSPPSPVQTAWERAEQAWHSEPPSPPPQYRSNYEPRNDTAQIAPMLIPAAVSTGLLAGTVGGPYATRQGYGGAPAPWNRGRIYSSGMLGGLGGILAGSGVGIAASVATKGKAAIPLVLGGAISGALGGSYLGGRAQRR
jgi:hypothetical protein